MILIVLRLRTESYYKINVGLARRRSSSLYVFTLQLNLVKELNNILNILSLQNWCSHLLHVLTRNTGIGFSYLYNALSQLVKLTLDRTSEELPVTSLFILTLQLSPNNDAMVLFTRKGYDELRESPLYVYRV